MTSPATVEDGVGVNASAFVNTNGGITYNECANNVVGSTSTSDTFALSPQFDAGKVLHCVIWRDNPFTILSVITWHAAPCV